MIANSPHTLDDFAGRWTLTRKIIQRNGDVFAFMGEAEFSWLEGSEHEESRALAYFENGEVTAPNGHVMPAERRYFWQQLQRFI